MIWEVLMAVDVLARYLKGRHDRDRLVRLARWLEQTPTRSASVRWKTRDTLYSPLHLGQTKPRERTGAE
jgi:hypothetical protein